MDIKDSSVYENIVNSSNIYKDLINKALDVVKDYILKKERILVGSMSIDYALRKKGSSLHAEETLPDFDFLTPEFHKDSYEIAKILYKIGLPEIQVLNAMHTSTVRIRTNFNWISDATYCPKIIYDKLPVIKYKGFKVIHPYYQYLDQHVVLGYPYKSPPWENINGRWKKDIARHEIYHKFYPVAFGLKEYKIKKTACLTIKTDDIKNQCLGGFPALFVWNNIASKLGFKVSALFKSMGSIIADKNKMKIKIPFDSNGITIYSDNLWDFKKRQENVSHKTVYSVSSSGSYQEKVKESSKDKARWFNSFMEKVPRKVLFGNWEVLDNMGDKIGASILNKDKNVYVANLQVLALYFLAHFVLFKTINKGSRGYSFYLAYKNIQELVKWASSKYGKDERINDFLPTEKTYGSMNYSESYIESKRRLFIKLKEKSNPSEKYRPEQVYMSKIQGKIPEEHYKFDPSKSPLYKFDGEQTEPFSHNNIMKEERVISYGIKK